MIEKRANARVGLPDAPRWRGPPTVMVAPLGGPVPGAARFSRP
jgi:hypothetical protein